MNHKVITLLICLFSMQGLINGRYTLGFLPRPIIWIGHLILIFAYLKVFIYQLILTVNHKLKNKLDLVEILLIISLLYAFCLIIAKDTPILAGLIGVKNFLMFPMIYIIIKKNIGLNLAKILSAYKFILILQILILLYQGLKLNWAAELMTGTFGFHTTGINGVIYVAVSLFGVISYIYTKNKKVLLLIPFIIINGISGVRVTFILIMIGVTVIFLYQLLFIKNKFRVITKFLCIMILIYFIVDYTHLYFEGVKISSLFINRFSDLMRLQILGYSSSTDNHGMIIDKFGRISSLIYVWNDLIEKGILFTGHGAGMSKESIMGGMVIVKEAFTFYGSSGGFAPMWYEFGLIGVLLYFSMILSCTFIFLHNMIKNKHLRYDPYLIWGIMTSALFLSGVFYTELWNTYAAFHYWLMMGLVSRNLNTRELNEYSYSR